MAKPRLLRDVFKGTNFFTGNIIDKFDYWIERNEESLTTYIITLGGDNKQDISSLVNINLDTNAYDLPKIILNAIINHYVFKDTLKECQKSSKSSSLLSNYDLIKHVNNLISWYVEETGDKNFSKIDPMVYEYIDDRLSELETAPFPTNTYKKWDDFEKLSKLAKLIKKNAEENKK